MGEKKFYSILNLYTEMVPYEIKLLNNIGYALGLISIYWLMNSLHSCHLFVKAILSYHAGLRRLVPLANRHYADKNQTNEKQNLAHATSTLLPPSPYHRTSQRWTETEIKYHISKNQIETAGLYRQ